jgi:hypothetical protein
MTFRGPDGEKINLIEWDLARAEAGERPEKWAGRPLLRSPARSPDHAADPFAASRACRRAARLSRVH